MGNLKGINRVMSCVIIEQIYENILLKKYYYIVLHNFVTNFAKRKKKHIAGIMIYKQINILRDFKERNKVEYVVTYPFVESLLPPAFSLLSPVSKIVLLFSLLHFP